jgi:methyl-accepting chemotaxis protein
VGFLSFGRNGRDGQSHSLLDAVGAPVMAIDKDFNITYINPAGAKLVGKTTAQMIGTKCYDTLQTSHCQTSECRCWQAMETGESKQGRTVSRAGGGRLPIQYAGNPLRGEQGEIVGAVEYVMELSEIYGVIGKVVEVAGNVSAASQQLFSAAEQAGGAATQLAATIQQVAEGTARQSEEVSRAAQTVEQVNRAIDGVAKGSQEQAEAVNKSSDISTQLTAVIQQVSANAKNSASGADKAAAAARAGTQTVEETIEGMYGIKAKTGLAAEKVQEMGQRSGQIEAIVETIEDIASQTNLLALNAAIEAARAGEHGKGFAVVADEVRKLAEKSAAATGEIASLIKGIQQTVAEAVQAMGEGTDEVEAGMSRANKAGEALMNILEASESVNEQVEEIAAAAERMASQSDGLVNAMNTVSAVVEENTATAEEMAASSGQVGEAIDGIASIGEENSAAAEEVSAATEEMSAQVEEVSASAGSLAEMARALQAAVAQFDLDGAVTAAAPSGSGHNHKEETLVKAI